MGAVLMDKETIYTAEQVRIILGLRTVRTVHRLIKRGDLDAFTVGRDYRIRSSALDAFTRKKKKEGQSEDREPIGIGA